MSSWFEYDIIGNYEKYLQENNLKIQALGVIKYPIYEIIGTIKKYVDDDISSLDYHIMKLVDQLENPEKSSLSLILGLTDGIVSWRLESLEVDDYLSVKGQKVKLTKKGEEFIQTPGEKIEIEITHKFFVDGITLKPMSKEYYGSKMRHTFIEQMDYDYEPDKIHTPPSDLIMEHINNISLEEKETYSIPKSFIELIDYDFTKLVHPLGVLFAIDNSGSVVKKLVDCCKRQASNEHLNEEKNNLEDMVKKIHVACLEYKRDDDIRTSFKTNLDNLYQMRTDHNQNRIFNMSKENIISAMKDAKFFGVNIIDKEDVLVSDNSITFNVDKKYFEIGRLGKKDIIRNLKRGMSYIYQERFGIYLIYIDFIAADEFVQNIVEIIEDYEKEDNKPQFLINKYGQEELRRLLLGIEYYNELEELDIILHFNNHLSYSHNGIK
jgi:hypothetical protein